MKLRTLISIIIVFSAIASATAQKEKHFDIGVQGGYGSVWIINQNNYGLTEMDYEYTWGGGFNFQLGYNFTENIGLFTEVGIMNQGQDYKDDWGNQKVKRSVKLKYLNVPLFFKYSYGESRARFRLLVGPQFGFLQMAEQTCTFDGVEQDTEDIKERFNDSDISFVLDLGADIFLVKGVLYLSAGARMFYGFTDINADEYQSADNYDASHNAGITFNLGLHYIIAGKK